MIRTKRKKDEKKRKVLVQLTRRTDQVKEIRENPKKGEWDMLNMIVKADKRGNCQRITIPKSIRKAKGWDDMLLYKVCLLDDMTVTIEEYLTYDNLNEQSRNYLDKQNQKA